MIFVIIVIIVIMSASFACLIVKYGDRTSSLLGWILLGVSPVVLFYCFSHSDLRIYSNHGFMHAGTVYQILEGQIPPLNPLLAGQGVIYPWAYHLISALLSKLFFLSPFHVFALINVVSLIISLVFCGKIARMLRDCRMPVIISVLCGIYLYHFIDLSKIHYYVGNLLDVKFDIRAIVLLKKFINATSMPLGVALFSISVYCFLVLSNKAKWELRPSFYFLISTTLLGLVYPLIYWPTAFSSGLVFAYRSCWGGGGKKPARINLCLLLFSLLIVFPYCYHLIGLNAASVGIGFELSLDRIGFRLWVWLSELSFFLLVIYLARKDFRNLYLSNKNAILSLGIFFTTLSLASVFLTSENYKFLLLSKFILGTVAGIFIWALINRKRVFGFTILFVLFLPTVTHMLKPIVRQAMANPINPVHYGDFRSLRFKYPPKDRFYRWIQESTSPKDVFLDLHIDIPVYSRRSLYISPPGYFKGYGNLTKLKGGLKGYEPKLLEERYALQKKVFSGDEEFNEALVETLFKSLPDWIKDIYIVGRSSRVRKKFGSSPVLSTVFSNHEGTIFKIERQENKFSHGLPDIGHTSMMTQIPPNL